MHSMKLAAGIQSRYVIKQLEKSAAPERGLGTDWYRYVIEGARSRIVGYTHGTLLQVMDNVQAMVAKINARSDGHSIYPWTPRRMWRQPAGSARPKDARISGPL